jgi:2-succinyl-5-enolpyruvyl-6-hydroxy-3-cyclohexene-1-carboxylate synthase
VADIYGVGFERATTRDEYREALQRSFAAPGVSVVEVKTDRNANLRLHQRIWRDVTAAVQP